MNEGGSGRFLSEAKARLKAGRFMYGLKHLPFCAIFISGRRESPASQRSMAWQLSQARRAKKAAGISSGAMRVYVRRVERAVTRVRAGSRQPAVKSRPTRSSFEKRRGRSGGRLRQVCTRVK
jgi:hypothetical protein